MQNLDRLLHQNDHKPYPAYKALKGRYSFPIYTLTIDHVQGDPFAAPSSLSIRVGKEKHGFPAEYYAEPHRRLMLQDLLLRGFGRELSKCSHMAKGSGKSGTLSVSRCGQAVLERSALTIDPSTGTVIVRFSAGFPAAGRTTLAMELKKMLFDLVPAAVERSLLSRAVPKERLEKWIALSDDQKANRQICLRFCSVHLRRIILTEGPHFRTAWNDYISLWKKRVFRLSSTVIRSPGILLWSESRSSTQ